MGDKIFINAGTYNKFCWKVEQSKTYFATIKSAGDRSAFYDDDGKMVAYYNERKERGWIRRPHCDLTGKELRFPSF